MARQVVCDYCGCVITSTWTVVKYFDSDTAKEIGKGDICVKCCNWLDEIRKRRIKENK